MKKEKKMKDKEKENGIIEMEKSKSIIDREIRGIEKLIELANREARPFEFENRRKRKRLTNQVRIWDSRMDELKDKRRRIEDEILKMKYG